jgi:probable rRNA maturation factor
VADDRIEIVRRPGVPALLPDTDLAGTLQAALEAAGAPPEATLSLTLSDDAELAALNSEHMGKEGPTDVLSFPLLPPSAFPAHAGQDPALRLASDLPGFALPPDEPVHLGDIVVSVERAVEQASDGRGGQTGDVAWRPVDELRLLVTHGALHVCGWDHADPEEEAAMRRLERRLLGLESGVAPETPRDPEAREGMET